MPRRPRVGTSAFVFHVFNRGIQGLRIFEQASDFDCFLSLLREAAQRFGVRVLAYSVMPTHWHLVLWPAEDRGLSACMHWLTGTHARRWRENRGSTGRGAVYQSRFKAIAVQRDAHLLTVCLYVERNPVRAQLVERAEDWLWSSACSRAQQLGPPIAEWPVSKPADWVERLNLPQPPRELETLRSAIRRGRPFGNVTWRSVAIGRLAWDIRCRPPGRPTLPYRAPRPDHLFG